MEASTVVLHAQSCPADHKTFVLHIHIDAIPYTKDTIPAYYFSYFRTAKKAGNETVCLYFSPR